LRKRKRAESPQQSEPKVIEEWIEESKLELWEIRAYREKMERDRNAALTRLRTGVTLKEPQRLDPGAQAETRKASSNAAAEKKQPQRTETIQVRIHSFIAKRFLFNCL